jgi:hypothetical protein
MSTPPGADWVVDGGDFDREWRECEEDERRFQKKVGDPEAAIGALPVREQERWRQMRLGLLVGRNRALLRLEVRRFQRGQPVRCPRLPLRRSRGSTRMHRARRVARTCGSRGDPDPPGDDSEDDDLVGRRLPAEVAS